MVNHADFTPYNNALKARIREIDIRTRMVSGLLEALLDIKGILENGNIPDAEKVGMTLERLISGIEEVADGERRAQAGLQPVRRNP